MASLSPVTAGRPVGEARFVRVILLPVHQTSHRRVFHDSDHPECVEFVYLYFPVLFCLSVSVKWLAVKTASEMTYTVSGGALNSTQTKPNLAKLRRHYRCVTLEECIGGVCSSAVFRPWARRRINHACDSDAWPLQRQTYGYLPSRRASLPFDQYQMLRLMTEADMCEQLASCHSKLSAIPAG